MAEVARMMDGAEMPGIGSKCGAKRCGGSPPSRICPVLVSSADGWCDHLPPLERASGVHRRKERGRGRGRRLIRPGAAGGDTWQRFEINAHHQVRSVYSDGEIGAARTAASSSVLTPLGLVTDGWSDPARKRQRIAAKSTFSSAKAAAAAADPLGAWPELAHVAICRTASPVVTTGCLSDSEGCGVPRRGALQGTRNVKVEPCPNPSEVHTRLPPKASAILRPMESPMPVPWKTLRTGRESSVSQASWDEAVGQPISRQMLLS